MPIQIKYISLKMSWSINEHVIAYEIVWNKRD